MKQVKRLALCSGHIKTWRSAQAESSGFVGSLSAVCTDQTILPAAAFGFNGTDQPRCNMSVSDTVEIEDPAEGTYTFR